MASYNGQLSIITLLLAPIDNNFIVPNFEESKEYTCSGLFFYSDQFSKIFPLVDRSIDVLDQEGARSPQTILAYRLL